MKPMVWLAWLLLDWPVTLTVGVLLIVVGLVGIPVWSWLRYHHADPADLGLSVLDGPTEELPKLPGDTPTPDWRVIKRHRHRRRGWRGRSGPSVPVVRHAPQPVRTSTVYRSTSRGR